MALERMLSLGATVVKSNFTRLDKPYKLNFSVTYWCQSRCIHCSIWQIRPKGELTLDEIQKFAEANKYFKWIELTGGEPFLRSDIVEIVKAFKENCKSLYLLTMPTNSLCNYEMEIRKIEEIAKMGIPNIVITVSLDGYRELHAQIRGISDNYDKAIRMFKGIKELGKKYKNLLCVFGFTIINQNAGQLEMTINQVKKDIPDLRFSEFHVNLGQTSENYYGNMRNKIIAPTELALKDVSYLHENMKREREGNPIKMAKNYLEIKYMEGLLEFIKTGKSSVANRDGELSVFMDSFGVAYPSIMTTKKLWNIREEGYDMSSMLKKYNAGKERESYFTACESYQSILGAIIIKNR